MLSIQSTKSQQCTPNLIPVRINHNGPINDTERYWKPESDDKDVQHVHFRGRHFHGTRLALPTNYTGAVLRVTDKVAPQQQSQSHERGDDNQEEDDEDMAQEENVEIKMVEQIGEFDNFVVWGHGGQIDGSQDTYVRGMEEWIGFAEKMHVDEDDEEPGEPKKVAA